MQATINSTYRKKTSKSKSILKPLLSSNYALAVFISDWRESQYFERAVWITCFQVYFMVVIVFLVFYPTMRSNEDLIYFYSQLSVVTFLLLVYFRRVVQKIFRNLGLHHNPEYVRKGYVKISLSLIFTSLTALVFAALSLWEIYEYHTRFFWWNK